MSHALLSESAIVGASGPACTEGPPWDLVHFPVDCPRCGANLHGRREAHCPECRLAFDWDDLVPLEHLKCQKCGYHLCGLHKPRCPECGEPFSWESALRDFRFRRKPFFEHHWRNQPLRSFWASWKLAFQPWKLWRTAELHDPADWRGLAALLISLGVVYLGLAPLVGNFEFFALKLLNSWLLKFGLGPNPGMWGDPTSPATLWGQFLLRMMGIWLAWAISGLGVLLILRQSMAQHRVRSYHVVRVVVYAMIPCALLPTLYMSNLFIWDILLLLRQLGLLGLGAGAYSWLYSTLDAASLAAIALSTISVAYGYSRYLKIPHGWLVALAMQAAAFFCVTLVASWLPR